MADRTSVLVLCCNRLLRELISRMLEKRQDFEVLPCDGQSDTPFEGVLSTGAHVVVLDSLDLYLDSVGENAKLFIQGGFPKCVLVAMADDHRSFLTAVRSGALGYVLQDASSADVLTAIRTVASGQAVCPSGYSRVLFDCIAGRTQEPASSRGRLHWGLTRREQQLIPLIGRGLTNKEIAAQFCLSERTIKNHIHRIFKKVGASSRYGLYEVWLSRVSPTAVEISN